MDRESQQGFIPLSYLLPWFDSFHHRHNLELKQVGSKVNPSTAAVTTCVSRVLLLNGKRYCSKRYATIQCTLMICQHCIFTTTLLSRYYVVARKSTNVIFISQTSLRVFASDAQERQCFFQPNQSLRNGRRVYVHFFCRLRGEP